jgi:hypothetical protein
MGSKSKPSLQPVSEGAPDEATRFRDDLMRSIRDAMLRAGAIDKPDPGMGKARRDLQKRP